MEVSSDINQLQYFQSLYLIEDEADVWFVFNGERVSSRTLILNAMSPYYKEMFHGFITPENAEIDMRGEEIVSAESFREFLKFFYFTKPHLTMENIEGVLIMAKRSSSDDIFAECEKFLMESMTNYTILTGYQLALRYEANDLKTMCEEEICVNAENVLTSTSFYMLPNEILHSILKNDLLACKETFLFKACLDWGVASTLRNNLDPANGENLRSQLQDTLHQIRFTSMTNQEAATCIGLCPGLFTENELQEIICMVANDKKFKPKQFNWTARYFESGRHLECSRLNFFDRGKAIHDVRRIEETRFKCDRRIILANFTCEINRDMRAPMHVRIIEINTDGHRHEKYSQQLTANFSNKRTNESIEPFDSYLAHITLNKPILLRPKYTYEIQITLENLFWVHSLCKTKQTQIVGDTIFHFETRGIVVVLTFRRFGVENNIRKVVHSPRTWMWPMILFLYALWYLTIGHFQGLTLFCGTTLGFGIIFMLTFRVLAQRFTIIAWLIFRVLLHKTSRSTTCDALCEYYIALDSL